MLKLHFFLDFLLLLPLIFRESVGSGIWLIKASRYTDNNILYSFCAAIEATLIHQMHYKDVFLSAIVFIFECICSSLLLLTICQLIMLNISRYFACKNLILICK